MFPHDSRAKQQNSSIHSNISLHTITKIETGDTPNPTVDTMKRIADALGVTIDDLIKEYLWIHPK